MKKIFAMASAAALTGLSMMAAIEWGTVDNLAIGATVTVSSNFNTAANVADNNSGSSWQAVPSTHKLTNDWALVDLGEVKTFTDIEIMFEASHARRYSVYVSETAIPYTSETGNVNTEDNPLMLDYNKIDADWLAAATPAVEGTDDTEANFTANHTFSTPLSGRYILVYADELNNFGVQYGMNIFEVRVANIAGRDAAAALKVTDANAKIGVEATVTVTAANVLGEPVDMASITDLTLTASSESVTVTPGADGVFTVVGTAPGTYTLTATAKAGTAEISGTATFAVEYDWDNTENIITSDMTVLGRVMPGLDDPHPFANATDGDAETYYEYNGQWGGGNTWLLIDLGAEYFVEAIGGQYGDLSGGVMRVGYALDNASIMAYVGENSEWLWGTAFTPEGWTMQTAARTSNAITTVIYANPVKARYIAVTDADNPNGKPQLREVLVKGTKIEESVATEMVINFDKGGLFAGESTSISLDILDQYGQTMGTAADVVYTVEAGNATISDGVLTANGKGMVTVKAVSGNAQATADIMVADQADYCMAGATVTSDVTKSTSADAIDGGADPTATGNLYIITEGEPQGPCEHWILADLHKAYDLDMIIAIWEGACPADYDVYVAGEDEQFAKLYSVTGHTQANWFDRFSGKEMAGVRYIKIVTTSNATGYGIKLYDLKAYGTSDVQSVATTITLESSMDYITVGESIDLTATLLDQFGGGMVDETVTFNVPAGAKVENGKFTADEKGTYAVTASCGDITSDEVLVHVVASAQTTEYKVVTEGAIAPYTVKMNGDVITADPFAGNEIQIADLPSTLEIEFDAAYDFDLIKLRWEAACPSHYTVKATYKGGAEATVLTVEDRAFQGGFNPVDRIVHQDAAAASSVRRVAALGTSSLKGVQKLTITPTARDHGYALRLFGIDTYGAQSLDPTAVTEVAAEAQTGLVDVYNLQGVLVRRGVEAANALEGLPQGVYVAGGRKVVK